MEDSILCKLVAAWFPPLSSKLSDSVICRITAVDLLASIFLRVAIAYFSVKKKFQFRYIQHAHDIEVSISADLVWLAEKANKNPVARESEVGTLSVSRPIPSIALDDVYACIYIHRSISELCAKVVLFF